MKIPIILLEFDWVPDNILFRTLERWWFKLEDNRAYGEGVFMQFPEKYVVGVLKEDLHENYYKFLLAEKNIIDEFESDYYDCPF